MNDQLGTKVPLKGEVYHKVVAAALHSIKSVNKITWSLPMEIIKAEM